MDLMTIGSAAGMAAGSAGITSWLFWKLLLKNIEGKQEKCVCEEKHKNELRCLDEIKDDVKETRKDVSEIKEAIVRLETKGES